MELVYKTFGNNNNPSLVVAHGFLGSSNDFEFLESHFVQDYYLVLIDLPASLNNPMPSPGILSFDLVSKYLTEIYQKLKIGNINLLGYSLGARLGLAHYFKEPQFYKRFIFESLNNGIFEYQLRSERAQKDLYLSKSLQQHGMQKFLQAWYDQAIFKDLPDKAERIAKMSELDPAQVVSTLNSLSVGRQNHYDFAHVGIPTTLFTGRRDPKFTEIAKSIVQSNSSVDHIQFNAGHNIHGERPDDFVEVLKLVLATA